MLKQEEKNLLVQKLQGGQTGMTRLEVGSDRGASQAAPCILVGGKL